jgi:hypothetical protein
MIMFKEIKVYLQKFSSNWKAETPKLAKFFRNLAGAVTGIIVVLSGIAGMFPNLNVPTWFTNYGWYVAGICALITAYSGAQKKDLKDPDKTEIPTNPKNPDNSNSQQ